MLTTTTKAPTMSSSATQTTVNRRHLYHLTTAILNAHSLHLIPISLLFLPATFSTSAAVQFYLSSTSATSITTSQTLITAIAFCSIVLVVLTTVAGVALITYTTNQIIHRKHVTFSSTFVSLVHAYIPLLHTVIAGSVKLIVIFIALKCSPIAITEAVKALGFHDHLFIFSILINSIVSCALAFTILFYIVIWGSAPAITVIESTSGFKALRQSANQSIEFRRHSCSIVYITGFGIIPVMWYSSVSHEFGPMTHWMSVLQVGAMCLQSSLMILMYVVANTVLYVQSKVAGGAEMAVTTVEGAVSGEYVRVGVNDEDDEVVDELVIEDASGGFNYMLYLLSVVWAVLFCAQFYHLFMMFSNV